MSDFAPGDVVVVVDAGDDVEEWSPLIRLTLGAVHTVSGVFVCPLDDSVCVDLAGIEDPEYGYDQAHFRKIVSDPDAFIRKVLEPVHIPAEGVEA